MSKGLYERTDEIKTKQSLSMIHYWNHHKHPALGTKRPDMIGNNFGHLLKGSKKSKEWKEKASIAKIEEKNPKWKNGIGAYRRIAYKNFGYKCNRCNISDKKVLLVHHKDRNRMNNIIKNLEVLCRNCHWIEHKFDKNGGV